MFNFSVFSTDLLANGFLQQKCLTVDDVYQRLAEEEREKEETRKRKAMKAKCINIYKHSSQFGSETVAQYKTLASLPGLARSIVACSTKSANFILQATNTQGLGYYPTCVKMFETVHITIVNQL